MNDFGPLILVIIALLVILAIVFVWWLRARRHHIPIRPADQTQPKATLPRASAVPSPSGTPLPPSPPAVREAQPQTPAAAAPVPLKLATPAAAGVASPEVKPAPEPAELAEPAKAPEPAPQVIQAAETEPHVAASRIPAGKDGADDLELIKGVGPKIVAILHKEGIKSFDQIAAWKAADIEKIGPSLGTFAGRVTRDQWIDQAKLLAKGDVAGFEKKFGKLER